MTIISILLAFALCHFVRELGRLRQFSWLDRLAGGLSRALDDAPPALVYLLVIVIPFAALALIQALMWGGLERVGLFLLSIAVLVYCFGPNDLDTEVSGIIDAPDEETQRERLDRLVGHADTSLGQSGQAEAVEAVFQQALRRWFGVIFWFAVLGVFGALLYRMATLIADGDVTIDDDARALFVRTRQIMDWPVAQLMTLALAIATDFDSVFAAWRQYHDEQGHGLFEGDNGFLVASARQVVLTGHAARDGYADQLDGPLRCVQMAMDLVWRVLGVWLTGLALLLLIDVIS